MVRQLLYQFLYSLTVLKIVYWALVLVSPWDYGFLMVKGSPYKHVRDLIRYWVCGTRDKAFGIPCITYSGVSRKCKLLSATVSGEHSPGEKFLFEPQGSKLQCLGLSSLDSLVTMHKVIPVQKFEANSVELPCGLELGIVKPFSEHDAREDMSHPLCARVVVNGPGYSESECSSQLLQILDLTKCGCSPSELGDLKALLTEHSEAFKMNKLELGHTTVVQHMIDTGSSGPIKQQPYQTHVVQRNQIA